MPYLKFLLTDKTYAQLSGNSYDDFVKGKLTTLLFVPTIPEIAMAIPVTLPSHSNDHLMHLIHSLVIFSHAHLSSPPNLAFDKNGKIAHRPQAEAWVKAYFLRRDLTVKKQKAERKELPGANVRYCIAICYILFLFIFYILVVSTLSNDIVS